MGFLRCQKKNFLIHMLLGLTGDRHGVIPTLLVRDVDSQYVDLW